MLALVGQISRVPQRHGGTSAAQEFVHFDAERQSLGFLCLVPYLFQHFINFVLVHREIKDISTSKVDILRNGFGCVGLPCFTQVSRGRARERRTLTTPRYPNFLPRLLPQLRKDFDQRYDRIVILTQWRQKRVGRLRHYTPLASRRHAGEELQSVDAHTRRPHFIGLRRTRRTNLHSRRVTFRNSLMISGALVRQGARATRYRTYRIRTGD